VRTHGLGFDFPDPDVVNASCPLPEFQPRLIAIAFLEGPQRNGPELRGTLNVVIGLDLTAKFPPEIADLGQFDTME